jgi:hypothetical protein
MTKDYLQYNFIEIVNFRDKLKKKEQILIDELTDLRARLKMIESIINRNEEVENNWLVFLPKEIVSSNKFSQPVTNGKVNWKKVVITIITKYDQPMTSEMLYFKSKMLYDNIPDDRIHCISNISAALHYLVFSDGKLHRAKMDNQRSYIYGLHHFFENNGKLKDEYYKKFRMEYKGTS